MPGPFPTFLTCTFAARNRKGGPGRSRPCRYFYSITALPVSNARGCPPARSDRCEHRHKATLPADIPRRWWKSTWVAAKQLLGQSRLADHGSEIVRADVFTFLAVCKRYQTSLAADDGLKMTVPSLSPNLPKFMLGQDFQKVPVLHAGACAFGSAQLSARRLECPHTKLHSEIRVNFSQWPSGARRRRNCACSSIGRSLT